MCIRTMKPKVTLLLFIAFQGAFPGLLSETNFESSHAYCISNTPSTFFNDNYKKAPRNGLTPKNIRFLINMAATISL